MLLGLDCGNTAVKAAVFDRDGRTISMKSRRTQPVRPGPSRVEHDMEKLWQLSCAAIAEALEALPGGGAVVDAVGVTAHGDGLYLIDRCGSPLGNGIQSVDSRAHGIVTDWSSRGVMERVVSITAQRPYPYAASTLLEWVRRNEPERYAAIGFVMFCKDWIRYRLTGVIVTDPTDASTAFTDARTQCYSDELLELLGLSAIRHALPEIFPSDARMGTVSSEAALQTGLVAGTPVASGMHDCTVSAIGLGNLTSGTMSITAGTFSINETLSDRLVVDARWTARAGLRPGQWMNMSISPASSNNVDWFIEQAYAGERATAASDGTSIWDAIAGDLDAPIAADAPMFHPFLYGSPFEEPMSASFRGLRSWHTRGDLLRAVIEGVAFNHRYHVDALRSAFVVDRVGITGGGSSNPRSAQLFADVLGVPVNVPRTTEASALGAALLAAVGVGQAASLDDAVARACHVEACYAPDPERHAMLSERFARYVESVETAREMVSNVPASRSPAAQRVMA